MCLIEHNVILWLTKFFLKFNVGLYLINYLDIQCENGVGIYQSTFQTIDPILDFNEREINGDFTQDSL